MHSHQRMQRASSNRDSRRGKVDTTKQDYLINWNRGPLGLVFRPNLGSDMPPVVAQILPEESIAKHSGVEVGDLLISIDGKKTSKIGYGKVVKKLYLHKLPMVLHFRMPLASLSEEDRLALENGETERINGNLINQTISSSEMEELAYPNPTNQSEDNYRLKDKQNQAFGRQPSEIVGQNGMPVMNENEDEDNYEQTDNSTMFKTRYMLDETVSHELDAIEEISEASIPTHSNSSHTSTDRHHSLHDSNIRDSNRTTKSREFSKAPEARYASNRAYEYDDREEEKGMFEEETINQPMQQNPHNIHNYGDEYDQGRGYQLDGHNYMSDSQISKRHHQSRRDDATSTQITKKERKQYSVIWQRGSLGMSFRPYSKKVDVPCVDFISSVRGEGRGMELVCINDVLIGINGEKTKNLGVEVVLRLLHVIEKPVVLRFHRSSNRIERSNSADQSEYPINRSERASSRDTLTIARQHLEREREKERTSKLMKQRSAHQPEYRSMDRPHPLQVHEEMTRDYEEKFRNEPHNYDNDSYPYVETFRGKDSYEKPSHHSSSGRRGSSHSQQIYVSQPNGAYDHQPEHFEQVARPSLTREAAKANASSTSMSSDSFEISFHDALDVVAISNGKPFNECEFGGLPLRMIQEGTVQGRLVMIYAKTCLAKLAKGERSSLINGSDAIDPSLSEKTKPAPLNPLGPGGRKYLGYGLQQHKGRRTNASSSSFSGPSNRDQYLHQKSAGVNGSRASKNNFMISNVSPSPEFISLSDAMNESVSSSRQTSYVSSKKASAMAAAGIDLSNSVQSRERSKSQSNRPLVSWDYGNVKSQSMDETSNFNKNAAQYHAIEEQQASEAPMENSVVKVKSLSSEMIFLNKDDSVTNNLPPTPGKTPKKLNVNAKRKIMADRMNGEAQNSSSNELTKPSSLQVHDSSYEKEYHGSSQKLDSSALLPTSQQNIQTEQTPANIPTSESSQQSHLQHHPSISSDEQESRESKMSVTSGGRSVTSSVTSLETPQDSSSLSTHNNSITGSTNSTNNLKSTFISDLNESETISNHSQSENDAVHDNNEAPVTNPTESLGSTDTSQPKLEENNDIDIEPRNESETKADESNKLVQLHPVLDQLCENCQDLRIVVKDLPMWVVLLKMDMIRELGEILQSVEMELQLERHSHLGVGTGDFDDFDFSHMDHESEVDVMDTQNEGEETESLEAIENQTKCQNSMARSYEKKCYNCGGTGDLADLAIDGKRELYCQDCWEKLFFSDTKVRTVSQEKPNVVNGNYGSDALQLLTDDMIVPVVVPIANEQDVTYALEQSNEPNSTDERYTFDDSTGYQSNSITSNSTGNRDSSSTHVSGMTEHADEAWL